MSLTGFEKEFDAWPSNCLALAYGPKVNLLDPEQEASPSLPSLGKECQALPSKSWALAYGPKVHYQESKRMLRRAFQVVERNSRRHHSNLGPWLMARKITFKNPKRIQSEPSEFWKRIRSLATQIFGLTLWSQG